MSQTHSVVVRTRASEGWWWWCVCCTRELLQGPCALRSDSPSFSQEGPLVSSTHAQLPGSPFLLYIYKKKKTPWHPLFSLPQRDAQVARREPQKAFGHQPSAQTAQIPGGGRGHQRGPQVLPLGGGHQQRVHRGEDTENHRLLWIPALECQLQQWVYAHTCRHTHTAVLCDWHASRGWREMDDRLSLMWQFNVHSTYGQCWEKDSNPSVPELSQCGNVSCCKKCT